MQIHVPAQLAEVLKDYTKEVIRRQPQNLLDFSAFYFANLANITPEEEEPLVLPTCPQISKVYNAALNSGSVRTCSVRPLNQRHPGQMIILLTSRDKV